MKIAVIGSTGFVGKKVVLEALHQNHEVYAIARSKQEVLPGVTNIQVDINNYQEVLKQIKDVDVIISAFNAGWGNPNLYQDFMDGSKATIEIAKALDIHLLIVGGASSLYRPDTNQQLFFTAPKELQDMVKGAFDLYALLLNEKTVKWTFVSPAIELFEGDKKENYNIGSDYVLFNHQNESKISNHDLAHLLVKSINQSHLFYKRITLAEK